jgi:hypothetical protein
MKNLKLNSEELRMLKTSLSTRMDFLETDQHKHNHKHHLKELEDLRELRSKLFNAQMGRQLKLNK